MRSLRSARLTYFAPVVILMMVVLFAQWIGLRHGIVHAGLQHSTVSVTQTDSDSGDAHHSCIAFDAAALADSISPGAYLAPFFTSARVLALWTAFASWDAPFSYYFSSRAPPLP